jgi:hypothetical protein
MKIAPARFAAKVARLVLVVVMVGTGAAYAQEPESDPEPELEPVPLLVSVGVDVGYPEHRLVAVRGSVQSGSIGLALHAGYGPGAGGYAGATVRGYPPLPGMPVPIWLGGGAGVSVAGFVPHAAAGVHVPLARRLRFDVEAGAAWPVEGEERRLAPQLAVGVSYAFATDVRPAAVDPAANRTRGDRGAASCEPGPPDPGLLGAAFDRAVDDILDDLRATYGSLYRGLSYDIDRGSPDLNGDEATFDVDIDGSVVEIATGERISDSVSATATFRWTGCGWSLSDLDY